MEHSETPTAKENALFAFIMFNMGWIEAHQAIPNLQDLSFFLRSVVALGFTAMNYMIYRVYLVVFSE